MAINTTFCPKKILVTTDFSEASYIAFPYATNEAYGSNAELEIVNVFEEPIIPASSYDYLPPLHIMGEIRNEAIAVSQKKLVALSAKHFTGTTVSTKLLEHIGSAGDAIVTHAKEENFDMIVVASHGHGFIGRIVLGSVAERVLRHAHCPVLVAFDRTGPSNDYTPQLPYKRILVPTDLSPSSEAAFPAAHYEAHRSGASITVISVIESLFAPDLLHMGSILPAIDAQEIQARYHQGLEDKLKTFVKTLGGEKMASAVLLDKTYSISNSITEYARSNHADLIIIATRGSGNRFGWLGGVVERVVRHAPCPVLVVPPPSDT